MEGWGGGGSAIILRMLLLACLQMNQKEDQLTHMFAVDTNSQTMGDGGGRDLERF